MRNKATEFLQAAARRFAPNLHVTEDDEPDERDPFQEVDEHLEELVRSPHYEHGLKPFLDELIRDTDMRIADAYGEPLSRLVGVRNGLASIHDKLEELKQQ